MHCFGSGDGHVYVACVSRRLRSCPVERRPMRRILRQRVNGAIDDPARAAGIIPLSSVPKTSKNIIQKELAFIRERSGSVTVPGTSVPRDPAPPAASPRRGCGGGGKPRRTNATEDPDVKTHRYATHHSVLCFATQ